MLLNPDQKQILDNARLSGGYRTIDQVIELAQTNTILDPFSLLISKHATVGNNNTFMPNVVLKCSDPGKLSIGNGNTFHSNTSLEATEGPIVVGDQNTFGEGAVVVKANMPGASITVGDNGRYIGQISMFGVCKLGSGSQILGNIAVYSCELGGGEPYSHGDPDQRAAVLKGNGSAKGAELAVGQVMNGNGNFNVPVERQSAYHPKKGD